MATNQRFLLSLSIMVCLTGSVLGFGLGYILVVTPLQVNMTLRIHTSSTVVESFPLQITLRTWSLANATWDHLTTTENMDVQILSYSSGIKINITNQQPDTTYTLTFIDILADTNETLYWRAAISSNSPPSIQEIRLELVQYNLRLGIFLTSENEWGRFIRYDPLYDKDLSGRRFDEITFLLWSVLASTLLLLTLITVGWTLSHSSSNSDQGRVWFRRVPFISLGLIIVILLIYILAGGTGLPEASVLHGSYGYSLSPAGIYWQLHPIANVLSSLLHGDYSHVSGNMLGYGMFGMMLVETWIAVPRRNITIAFFFAPLVSTIRALLIGSPIGTGASNSISCVCAFGLVWLLINRRLFESSIRELPEAENFPEKVIRCFQWVWNRRSIISVLLFGYVTVTFLWGWIGNLVYFWYAASLDGMNIYYLGKIVLATEHLKWYFIGICVAVFIVKIEGGEISQSDGD